MILLPERWLGRFVMSGDVVSSVGVLAFQNDQVLLVRSGDASGQGFDETAPEWVEIEKVHSLNLLPNVDKAILAGRASLKEEK